MWIYVYAHIQTVLVSLIPSICPQTHTPTHENIQPSSNSSISPFTHTYTQIYNICCIYLLIYTFINKPKAQFKTVDVLTHLVLSRLCSILSSLPYVAIVLRVSLYVCVHVRSCWSLWHANACRLLPQQLSSISSARQPPTMLLQRWRTDEERAEPLFLFCWLFPWWQVECTVTKHTRVAVLDQIALPGPFYWRRFLPLTTPTGALASEASSAIKDKATRRCLGGSTCGPK